MTHRAMQNRRNAVVFAAAVVLLLQALFGAFASAAQAAAMPYDAFGNPLCITSAAHDGGRTHEPAAMPSCCMLACQAAATLLPEPDTGTLSISGAWIAIAAPLPSPLQLPHRNAHEPGNPRAPPAFA